MNVWRNIPRSDHCAEPMLRSTKQKNAAGAPKKGGHSSFIGTMVSRTVILMIFRMEIDPENVYIVRMGFLNSKFVPEIGSSFCAAFKFANVGARPKQPFLFVF